MNDLDTNPLRGAAEVGMQIRVWVNIDQNFFSAWCHTYDVIDQRYEFNFFDGTGHGLRWTARDIKVKVQAGNVIILRRPGFGDMALNWQAN